MPPSSLNFKNTVSKEYRAHRNRVNCVGWNCHGSVLASAGADGMVRLWTIDLAKGITKNSLYLKGHTAAVTQITWHSSDPSFLASASLDKTLKIWDFRIPNFVKSLDSKSGILNCRWGGKNGEYVAIGTRRDEITVYDTKEWKVIWEKKFDVEINEMLWDKNAQYLVLATGLGEVWFYDSSSFELLYRLKGHTSNCYTLSSECTGRFIASGAADSLVCVWDLENMSCANSMDHIGTAIRSLDFNHDGNYLAIGSEDNSIDIINLYTGKSVFQIDSQAPVNSIDWHPRENLIAYSSDEVDKYGSFRGNFRIHGFKN